MLTQIEIQHAENIIKSMNKGVYNNMTGIEIMAYFHSVAWLADLVKRSKDQIELDQNKPQSNVGVPESKPDELVLDDKKVNTKKGKK